MVKYFKHVLKSSLSTGHLPSNLGKAENVPAYKKYESNNKPNYSPTPIRIFPSLHKLCKGCLYNQIFHFFEATFQKHL